MGCVIVQHSRTIVSGEAVLTQSFDFRNLNPPKRNSPFTARNMKTMSSGAWRRRTREKKRNWAAKIRLGACPKKMFLAIHWGHDTVGKILHQWWCFQHLWKYLWHQNSQTIPERGWISLRFLLIFSDLKEANASINGPTLPHPPALEASGLLSIITPKPSPRYEPIHNSIWLQKHTYVRLLHQNYQETSKYSNKFAQSTALGTPAVPLAVRIQDVFWKVLPWWNRNAFVVSTFLVVKRCQKNLDSEVRSVFVAHFWPGRSLATPKRLPSVERRFRCKVQPTKWEAGEAIRIISSWWRFQF